ncbi:hypothetical protein COCNU_02G008910 [Cocos nucifera]|uniref:Uncharacterized protein n=1 Tax=Cocos nucifera TaxID=13894 RepID=A0A8K0HZ49_COCNU|nr:hypothetical protein COCNU_02G008910 [Cocos nucifera]
MPELDLVQQDYERGSEDSEEEGKRSINLDDLQDSDYVGSDAKEDESRVAGPGHMTKDSVPRYESNKPRCETTEPRGGAARESSVPNVKRTAVERDYANKDIGRTRRGGHAIERGGHAIGRGGSVPRRTGSTVRRARSTIGRADFIIDRDSRASLSSAVAAGSDNRTGSSSATA